MQIDLCYSRAIRNCACVLKTNPKTFNILDHSLTIKS